MALSNSEKQKNYRARRAAEKIRSAKLAAFLESTKGEVVSDRALIIRKPDGSYLAFEPTETGWSYFQIQS